MTQTALKHRNNLAERRAILQRVHEEWKGKGRKLDDVLAEIPLHYCTYREWKHKMELLDKTTADCGTGLKPLSDPCAQPLNSGEQGVHGSNNGLRPVPQAAPPAAAPAPFKSSILVADAGDGQYVVKISGDRAAYKFLLTLLSVHAEAHFGLRTEK